MNDPSTGRLADHSILVTGAGGGIGLAIAQAVHDQGAHVVAADRTLTPALLDLGRTAPNVQVVTTDVTDPDQVGAATERLTSSIGHLGVVHCAAVQLPELDGKVADLDLAALQQTLQVNLAGAFLVARAAVRRMLAVEAVGSIVLCGSPTALRGSSDDFSAYSMSKGGVHALTRVLANSYAAHSIRANTLVPGPTLTPLTQPIFDQRPDNLAALLARVPLGRLGRPEDYAGAAVFLLSTESSFATGSEFVVDGGLTIS